MEYTYVDCTQAKMNFGEDLNSNDFEFISCFNLMVRNRIMDGQQNTIPSRGAIISTYVTWHEKIGLMCTHNLTTFLDFKIK